MCACVQNIMTFNKCSIKGNTYGDPLDERGVAVDVTEVYTVMQFSTNSDNKTCLVAVMSDITQFTVSCCSAYTLPLIFHVK